MCWGERERGEERERQEKIRRRSAESEREKGR